MIFIIINNFLYRNITKIGRTALMLASEYGHVNIVKELLALPDIDINKNDNVRTHNEYGNGMLLFGIAC